jgi:hypothetical protein
MPDVLRTISDLGATQQGSVFLRDGASEEAIDVMQAAARRVLGEAVPDSYAAFLRISNGVQISGAYLLGAETLVPENEDLYCPEVIILGNEGNMVYYVFDRRDKRFYTITQGDPDERHESYDSFEDMLMGILKEQNAL